MRLTDDFQYESEDEEEKEEKEQQTSKKPGKKEALKKLTKDNASNFNTWVNRKETGINSEIFQKHFKFQRPSYISETLCIKNDKKTNSSLVNVIKSEVSDLKIEIENMSEE